MSQLKVKVSFADAKGLYLNEMNACMSIFGKKRSTHRLRTADQLDWFFLFSDWSLRQEAWKIIKTALRPVEGGKVASEEVKEDEDAFTRWCAALEGEEGIRLACTYASLKPAESLPLDVLPEEVLSYLKKWWPIDVDKEAEKLVAAEVQAKKWEADRLRMDKEAEERKVKREAEEKGCRDQTLGSYCGSDAWAHGKVKTI